METLLGIETRDYQDRIANQGDRNQLETLLGIETSRNMLAMAWLTNRNQLETLLGIETFCGGGGWGRWVTAVIEINWKPF